MASFPRFMCLPTVMYLRRLGIYRSACEFSGACHSSGSFDDVGRVAVRYFIWDDHGFHSGHGKWNLKL
jgi:hypothetical protein